MTRIAQQVSRAIRILRGNRDESARASHLVVNKDRFAYNGLLQVNQAEREKCSQSTFSERKIMSTKTAFKRIALVAAAALAIGGVSAVSAQATGTSDWYITATSTNVPTAGASITAETATQIAGPGNFVTLNNNQALAVYFTVTGGATTAGATSGTVAGTTGSVSIATPTVGTITVTSYDISALGAASTTATSTVTISVVAALAQTVYGSSTVYGGPGTSIVTADATIPNAVAGALNVANFNVTELDNSSTPLSLTTGWKPITVTVTNGLISTGTVAAGFPTSAGTTYISGTQTAAGSNDFILNGIPGLSGTSTVTISVNGVVVKTYSVVFTGTAVKLVLTAVNSVVGVGSATSLLPTVGVSGVATGITANTNALEIQEFDANGNAIAVVPSNVVITPAASTIATAGSLHTSGTLGDISGGTALSTSVVGADINGVAAGTTTFTATDSTTVSGTTLTSAPVSVRVSSGVPTSVVLSTDAASYSAGAAGTLTTTLSDAAGTLPAGTYVPFTGQATSSYALTVGTASLPGAPAAIAGTVSTVPVVAGEVTVNDAGVYTDSFNAPISDATGVTISATPVTAATGATQIVVTPATFDVASGSSQAANAATDAANEATDAANAATDAANAAADSADAATQAAMDAGDKADAALAAVTALSQQVTTLLAKVAALAATIAKIAKKVKA
jgi:hypothetical protein